MIDGTEEGTGKQRVRKWEVQLGRGQRQSRVITRYGRRYTSER